jgi:hypothetical protein
MAIELSPELEAALKESARQQGVSPQVLATNVLSQQFLSPATVSAPGDPWERMLRGAATDCGVSLPHSALSSEGLYE